MHFACFFGSIEGLAASSGLSGSAFVLRVQDYVILMGHQFCWNPIIHGPRPGHSGGQGWQAYPWAGWQGPQWGLSGMWRLGREVPWIASGARHTAAAFAPSLEPEADFHSASAPAWTGSPAKGRVSSIKSSQTFTTDGSVFSTKDGSTKKF